MSNNFKKSSTSKETNPKPVMKKSIVRNVQVPLPKSKENPDNQNNQFSKNENPGKSTKVTFQNQNSNRNFHDPKYNTINELQKKLDDVKMYIAKQKAEANPSSEVLINKEVSKKLNFPPKQQVYKNLPAIYNEEKQQKANKVLKDTKLKIKDVRNKSHIQEIDDMLKNLVSLEYEEKYLENKIPQFRHTYASREEEFIGSEKFKGMRLHLMSEKEDDEQFQQMNRNNCLIESGKYDDYDNYIPMHRCPPLSKVTDKDCKCYEQYYYEKHSNC